MRSQGQNRIFRGNSERNRDKNAICRKNSERISQGVLKVIKIDRLK